MAVKLNKQNKFFLKMSGVVIGLLFIGMALTWAVNLFLTTGAKLFVTGLVIAVIVVAGKTIWKILKK